MSSACTIEAGSRSAKASQRHMLLPLAHENRVPVDQCGVDPACQLQAEEGRVLALADQGAGIHFPVLCWVDEAEIGCGAYAEMPGIDAQHGGRHASDA